MLINVTWALVLAGLGLVIGGFIVSDQNILLILAIAAELAAIVLVLASWARRAKDAADVAFDDDLSFADDAAADEPDDEELFATLGDDDEFAVGARTSRRPARRTTTARKAKPKAKPKAKTAARKPAAKSTAKTTATKRKPAAKAKAKPKAKPKPKPKAKPKAPRRRPS